MDARVIPMEIETKSNYKGGRKFRVVKLML